MTPPLTLLGIQVAPVLLTAAGTLLGVILTVSVQALSSFFQRRYEKSANLVELRLEAYSEFLTALYRWGRARAKFEALKASPELAKLDETSRRQSVLLAEANAAVAELESKGELAQDDRERARTLAEHYKAEQDALPDEMRLSAAAAAPVVEKMRSAQQQVQEANDRLQNLVFRVSLLGGKQVRQALEPVANSTIAGADPSSENREKLERAIRRELYSE